VLSPRPHIAATKRRSSRRILAGLLTVLAVAAWGAATADATPTAAGRLTPHPAMGAAGALVTLTGRVGDKTSHKVELQRYTAGRFVTIATQRSDSKGQFKFTSRLPWARGRVTYRVLASEHPRASETQPAVTPSRKVLITNNTTQRIGSASTISYTPSADGRYVIYADRRGATSATDLFMWDRITHRRQRIADDVGGVSTPSMTPDGRYVSYGVQRWEVKGSGEDVYFDDVYTWDRATGTTTLITLGNTYGMTHGDDFTSSTAMSANGQFVVYNSDATNGLADDRNGGEDLFLWDRATETTTRLTNTNNYSYSPSISADGNLIAFESSATNLVPGPRNGADVYMLDRTVGSFSRITAGNDASVDPAISADGRHVTFTSIATDLVLRDDNRQVDVFTWDRITDAFTRVTNGNGFSTESTISADGRYVTYQSEATNLVPGDTNGVTDVFISNLETGTRKRITNGNGPSMSPNISEDGHHVAYRSQARNLVPRDRRAWGAFLWDRAH
jgi:Tol biopolymer transport system component